MNFAAFALPALMTFIFIDVNSSLSFVASMLLAVLLFLFLIIKEVANYCRKWHSLLLHSKGCTCSYK